MANLLWGDDDGIFGGSNAQVGYLEPARRPSYSWALIAGDSSEIEIELFLDRQKQWTKKNSQPEACQVCPVRFTEHSMYYVIYKCNAKSCAESANLCDWFLRTMVCDATKRGTVEQHGHHVVSVVERRGRKLNLQMKRFFRAQVQDRMRPSRILNGMIDAHLFDIDTDAASFPRPVTRYTYHYRTRGLNDNNDVGGTERILANRQFHPDLPDCQIQPGSASLIRGTRPVNHASLVALPKGQ